MHELRRDDHVVDVEAALPSGGAFKVWRRSDGPGALTTVELCVVCSQASSRRPRKVLEWGTGRGVTTLNLAINAPEAEVHTIAPPVKAETAWITGPATYAYATHAERSRVRQHYGTLPKFDFWQVGRGISLCLVHASCGEEARTVTARVLPLMVNPGLILWHDMTCAEPAPRDPCAMAEFLRELAPLGVAFVRGTSLARLPVARGTRRDVAAHLGFDLEE